MTKKQVAEALKANAEEIERTDRALKHATDLRAPKGAKRAATRLRHVLRKIRKRLFARRKELKAKLESGPQKATAWANKQVGITESPPNSNWGHPVQDWIVYTGYDSAVPWCGCFACFAVVHEGGADIPVRIRLGYAGYINSDASSGSNGLRAVPFDQAQEGDIYTIGNSHIGYVVRREGDYLLTCDGNTSPTEAGSQYNGGAVARKERHRSIVTTVARPDYA